MGFLVLNQYRTRSEYKDVPGKLYHFPNRYLKAFSELPSSFVYYESRRGGEQVYFGTGMVLSVYEDTEDVAHSYAEIGAYETFPVPVNFYQGPAGGTWEPARTMRNSVRALSSELFHGIVKAGGIVASLPGGGSSSKEPFTSALKSELASYPGPGQRPPHLLKRIKRILETFERPSTVTNGVKKQRGDKCQLCGVGGFIKRDGRRYCEVHHLFHLADDPPANCLEPEYLVVLCATCHRRLHYANVEKPKKTNSGWLLVVDGTEVLFKTA